MRAVKLLSMVVVFGLAACGQKVATIDLAPKTVVLSKKGDSVALTAVPKDAQGAKVEGQQVVFTSAAADIATVDTNGKVTAVKTGETTVVATAGAATASVPVKVSIPASINFAPKEVALEGVGAKAAVTAKVVDEKGKEVPMTIAWESADAKVATVANGQITAVAAGETQVFAIAGNLRSPVKVAVKVPVVAAVEADKTLEVKVGAEPVKVKALAKDADGNEIASATFTYACADAKIATVDADGMVTGLAKGKTKLTITSGEKSATVEVKVKK